MVILRKAAVIELMERIDIAGGRIGDHAPEPLLQTVDGYALGMYSQSLELFSNTVTLTRVEGWHGVAIIGRTLVEQSCRLWEIERADRTRRSALEVQAFIDGLRKEQAILESWNQEGYGNDDIMAEMGRINRDQAAISKTVRESAVPSGAKFAETEEVLRSRGWAVEVATFKTLHQFVHGTGYSHRLNRVVRDDGTWEFSPGRPEGETWGTDFGLALALFSGRCLLGSAVSIYAIIGTAAPTAMFELQTEVEYWLGLGPPPKVFEKGDAPGR